jgi:uncharacterized membrane protein YdfJ with MMPL/SSD domain
LNELSFVLVFSVLFDTFVVRSMMVPALMGILGEWSWWGCRRAPTAVATATATANLRVGDYADDDDDVFGLA